MCNFLFSGLVTRAGMLYCLLGILLQTNAFSQITLNSVGASYKALASSLTSDPNVIINNATGQRGSGNQMALFDNAGGNKLAVTNGILLATGDVRLSKPNFNSSVACCKTSYTDDPMLPVDPELASVSVPGASIYDWAILEFDIKISTGNALQFTYVFASDEYPEYVCSEFDDAFGFWIKGGTQYPNMTNVSLTPIGKNQVSINYINNGTMGEEAWGPCPAGWNQNTGLYLDNSPGPHIEADGLTRPMVSNLSLSPNVTYHFKIAIADVSDEKLDSWVYVAGKFTTLPVDITSFSSKTLDANAVKLTWSVAQERNFSHYIVERSKNPLVDFEETSSITATGASRYSYVDDSDEGNYYRLKLVDKDGTFTYSTVIYVSKNLQADNEITIRQGNNGEYVLNYTSESTQEAVLMIRDAIGKEVMKQTIKLEEGSNLIPLVNLESINEGIHVATLVTMDKTMSYKFRK